MAMDAAVGACLWLKSGLQLLQPQAPPLQQLRQHGIGRQPQLIGVQLQGHMAIAEVIRSLEQGQGIGGRNHQQCLWQCFNHHLWCTRLIQQQFPRDQALPPGQLQQHRQTAKGVAPAPQNKPLRRRKGQARQG